MNIERKENFTQVCVWPATVILRDEIDDFVKYFASEFKTRIQFLEVILTNPTPGEEGTGGRSDIFFAVHQDDIAHFAVPRIQVGIRWIEDALSEVNKGVDAYGKPVLYPERVLEYKTW